MVELSAEQIAQRALDLDLLDDRSYREIAGEARNLDAPQFQQLLLRRELLTPYQMERMMRGDRSGFFYGQYKVLYQVGAGTFARVYRAAHRDTREIVALKVLRQRFSNDEHKRDRFYKEAEVGESLRHPNIVAIHEVGSTKSAHFIIMEFVEGQTLRDFVRIRKRLQPLDAVRLMVDISRGLDYAARRGVYHRDIKTSNVLVSATGQAKLVDFGLAGIDPNISDEALAGIENPRTIDYVTLERASGVRKDDNRSDIYFTGVMMYHMLAGEPPLVETRDRLQRLNTSRFFDVTPLRQRCPDLPLGATTVCDKAMELSPKMRYSTPGDLLADLIVLQQRLSEGEAADLASLPSVAGKQKIVMLVEASPKLQDTLRDQLKRHGFRVLVTADPARPLTWFSDGMSPAGLCAVQPPRVWGRMALEAFNRFGDGRSDSTRVPAVLLLGAKNADLESEAKLSPYRAVVTSPFKMQAAAGLAR